MSRVMLLGDSIRLGYQQTVKERLAERALVTGPEANCGSSEKLWGMVMGWEFAVPADVVHVNAGLHDLAVVDRNTGVRRVSLANYQQNLRQVLHWLLERTERRVIFATTTPVLDARHQAAKPIARHATDVELYNAAAVEVCEALDVAVHDLHALVMSWDDPGASISNDGVHFTAAGYAALGEAVAERIEAELNPDYDGASTN